MPREAVGSRPSPAYGLGPTPPGSLPEGETEAMSNAQRSTLKWEKEETLGELATVAPVLYTNVNFPNLKEEYPGLYMALSLKIIKKFLLISLQLFGWTGCTVSVRTKILYKFCETVGMTTLFILSTDWCTRVKQIAKLWRKASSQDRAPYVVRT